MKLEIQENPGEQKSSQVGRKTSSVKDYIEVVPSLPTYHMSDVGTISKVLKYLFNPDNAQPEKMLTESNMGFCLLENCECDCFEEFSTIFGHPDTIAMFPAGKFLDYCDMDVDQGVEELKKWGITQVDLGQGLNISVDTKTFFDALKKYVDGDTDEIVIPCQREVAAELHFLCKEIDDDEEDDEDVEEDKDAD
jgi:hypothetical protein